MYWLTNSVYSTHIQFGKKMRGFGEVTAVKISWSRWRDPFTTPFKNAKLGQNGSISRKRLKLETSNLAHRLATGGPNEKNAKLDQKGSWKVTWPTLWNFETPSISRERLKLETSNVAHKLATGGPKRNNNTKLGQRGSWWGYVTYFSNFGTPSMSPERLKLETSNLADRQTVGPNEKKIQN